LKFGLPQAVASGFCALIGALVSVSGCSSGVVEEVQRPELEGARFRKIVEADGQARFAEPVAFPFTEQICLPAANVPEARRFEIGARSDHERAVLRLSAPGGQGNEFALTDHWLDFAVPLPTSDACIQITLEGPPGGSGSIDHPRILQSGERRPWVILYVIDTLRSDATPLGGAAVEVAPALLELASEGITYRRAFATSSWTRTTVATLLTGLDPARHRVEDRQDRLDLTIPRLPIWLRRAGWETAALSTNPNILPSWGFMWGFDRFIDVDSGEWLNRVSFSELHEQAVSLVEQKADRPVFLYVHDNEPHFPYLPSAHYRELLRTAPEGSAGEKPTDAEDAEVLDEARLLYSSEIRSTTDRMRSLFDALRRIGRYDDALIVVAGDHGEEFGDHGGLYHGSTLYQEQIHIPLIIKPPRGRARTGVVESAVTTEDVAPTILALLDLPAPERLGGRRLPFPGEDRADAAAAAPTPVLYGRLNLEGQRVDTAILWPWKYLHILRADDGRRSEGEERLFDLGRDPEESEDLAADRPKLLAFLREGVERRSFDAQQGLGFSCLAGRHKSSVRLEVRSSDHAVPGFRGSRLEGNDSVSAGRGWLSAEFRLPPALPTRGNPYLDPVAAAMVQPDRDGVRLPHISAAGTELRLNVDEALGPIVIEGPAGRIPSSQHQAEVIDLAQITTSVVPRDLVPDESARCRLFFLRPREQVTGSSPIDAELRMRLEALGYLHEEEE
jgi:arylsulfatase A-like enzyme